MNVINPLKWFRPKPEPAKPVNPASELAKMGHAQQRLFILSRCNELAGEINYKNWPPESVR